MALMSTPASTTEHATSSFRRPGENLLGHLTLLSMNLWHAPLHRWGLAAAQVGEHERVLDIGCGGGAVARRLLKATRREVGAIDHSPTAIVHTQRLCAESVASGRLRAVEADVAHLPFRDSYFDVVTAFETVYFWPDLHAGLAEVRRVLGPRGRLVIANEVAGHQAAGVWAELIDMEVPDGETLREACEQVGFSLVEIDHHPRRGWLRAIAYA